jgi:hypothetical protein
MTPFSATPPSHPELSLGQRLFGRAPVIVFIVLLILGLAAVGWRAAKRGAESKTQARAQAALAGLALERELAQAVTAAEALGVAAGLPGSSAAGFDGMAIQLMASRPGLSSLEWAPGGVVNAVFPRSGNERALGRNLLRDPAQAGAANEAFRRRQTLVFGPVPNPRGEAVFVSLRPVFVRARDGRENFWGFVSASVRKNDVLARAQLDQLRLRGYEYHFFLPPFGARRAFTVSSNGSVAVDAEVQQRIRAHNFEMILAVEPAAGWYGWSTTLLQTAAIIFGAGLLALLVALKEERLDLRSSIDELQTKLGRESSEKAQAQEDCKAARNQITTLQTELARNAAAVQASENALVELRSELDSLAAAEGSSRVELQKVLEQRREFQDQMEKESQATQHELSTAQTQLSQVRTELEKQASQVRDLRAQLEQSTRDAAKAAEKLERERAQDQASLAEWKARFEQASDAAKRNEQEQAEKLATAHQQISALTEALAVTKRDLEAAASLLEAVEPAKPEAAAESEPQPQPIEELVPIVESNTVESEPEPESPEPAAADEPTHAPLIPEESLSEPTPQTGPEIPAALAPVENVEPIVEAASSEAKLEPVGEDPAVSDVPSAVPAAEAPEVQPKAPSEKPARKRKARKDQQIDLFSLGDAPAQPLPPAAAAPSAPEPEKAAVVQTEPVPEPAREPEVQAAVATMPGPADDRDYTEVFTETIMEEKTAPSRVPNAETAEITAKPAEVDFPSLPGLVVSEGLSLADGDPGKYMKALRLFVEHQRKATLKIRDHMVQGDMPAAERVLNSLKVAAGEISAISLRESATKLDQAIHGESEPAEVEFLWLEVDKNLRDLLAGLKPILEEAEENRAPSRPAEPRLKVDVGQLRKAVNQILPLLTDNDPGAKDCFKDYRSVFRPAFASEAFEEFEQAMKRNDFGTGLELLKKAVKKHGIT